MQTERKEHEKMSEAEVTKKEILNSKGMEPILDKGPIPYKGIDMCYVHLKINNIESILCVPYDVYKKYNVGDKIVLHILRSDKEQDVNVTLGERSQ